MKTSLIITTINKLNKNLKNFDKLSHDKNWNFIVIGDKKSPKNFNLKYGKYYNLLKQKRTNIKFAKACPEHNYARKNIGYLLAIKNNSDVIIETDDDNYPKKNFFENKKLIHKCSEINNKDWINIYDLFTNSKTLVWPRGLPLSHVKKNKIKLTKKISKEFYIQQGVCEKNPDVDAIYRLINDKINIKFKQNYYVSLGNSYSPFNSQNTIWFKKAFPLMYLPVTCSMRSTDIVRGLIALRIMNNDKKNILFFGTSMFQNRNEHNLYKDFEGEIPIYLHTKKILNLLFRLKLKKGFKNYLDNLMKCYTLLILNGLIKKKEIVYLKKWIIEFK